MRCIPTVFGLLGVAPGADLDFNCGDGMSLGNTNTINGKLAMTRNVFTHFVRLTDMLCTDLRKANMVEFALSDKLGHDARALIEGHTMDDTCRLKQVEFLGPTELGEDKANLAFKLYLPATDILTAIPDDGCGERTGHHMG